MRAFWIEFEDGAAGCCEGADAHDASRIAGVLRGSKVTEAYPLPYPAYPIIWQFDHPVLGTCPAFCRTPKKCKGKSGCPKNPSCTS